MAGLTSRNFTIPGGMGPVLAQQRPDGQRARRLAHMLMEQGSESGPVRSHMEGIARAGKAMAGAWMQRQADERAGERSQAYQDTLAEAMRAKGWTDPDTGQVPPGASKTDFMAQILAGNQDTAPMAMNMQLQQDRERQAMAEQLRRDDSARADKQMTTLTPEQMAEHNLPQGSGWEKDAHGGLHSLYDAPEAPSAPTTRRRIEGGELVEEEWRNGAWELLSRGPRWSASERQTGRELTPPQQRSNTKIEHARNWLRQSGLGPDELRQKLGSNTDVLQWLDTQDPVVRQAWSAASQPLYGDDPEYADFWTRFAPAARCLAASSRLVKMPVDSSTMSTPSSPHGRLAGSRSAVTPNRWPPSRMPSPSTFTSSGRLPSTESYFSRCASVSAPVMSFTATRSMSLSPRAARMMFRPIRPNPLIPSRVAI